VSYCLFVASCLVEFPYEMKQCLPMLVWKQCRHGYETSSISFFINSLSHHQNYLHYNIFNDNETIIGTTLMSENTTSNILPPVSKESCLGQEHRLQDITFTTIFY
jgi:hypothetical protein